MAADEFMVMQRVCSLSACLSAVSYGLVTAGLWAFLARVIVGP